MLMPFKGSSMLPTIPYSCDIIVSKVRRLKLEDIYIYVDDDPDSHIKLVCHRLIKIENCRCYFKGDNRLSFDRPVKITEVRGNYEGWTNKRNPD